MAIFYLDDKALYYDHNLAQWHTITRQASELMQRGHYREAEKCARKALEVALKYAKSMDLVANSYNNLACMLSSQGCFNEAEDLFETALEQLKHKNPKLDDLSAAAVYCGLAELKYNQDAYDKAEYYLLKAIQIKENNLPKGHHSLVKTVSALCVLYSWIGEKEKEEELRNNKLNLGESDPWKP